MLAAALAVTASGSKPEVLPKPLAIEMPVRELSAFFESRDVRDPRGDGRLFVRRRAPDVEKGENVLMLAGVAHVHPWGAAQVKWPTVYDR